MLERTLTHICPAYSDQCLQPTLYKQTIMVQYKRMYKNTTVALTGSSMSQITEDTSRFLNFGVLKCIFKNKQGNVTYSLTTSIITYLKKKKSIIYWYNGTSTVYVVGMRKGERDINLKFLNPTLVNHFFCGEPGPLTQVQHGTTFSTCSPSDSPQTYQWA